MRVDPPTAADVEQDDEAAWQQLAERHPPAAARRSRLVGRRPLAAVLLLVVIAVVVGAAIGFLRGHADARDGKHVALHHRHERPVPLQIAGFTLLVAGLAVETVGVVRASRRGLIRSGWNSPLRGLPLRERRQVVLQIRGRRPVPEADIALVRATARRIAAQTWLKPLYAGFSLMAVGQLLANSGIPAVLSAAGLLVFVGAAPLIERDVRRARQFLETHPARA